MIVSEDFSITLEYSKEEDKISIKKDRALNRGEIVMLLSNLFLLLERDEREFASKIALEAIKYKEEKIPSAVFQ
jgi:hypothetical protein